MKILITGGTGYLGSHLIRELLNLGYKVILLKRSFSNTFRIQDIFSELTVYDLDNTTIKEVFNQQPGISAVIHTATLYGRESDLSTIRNIIDSNITFPLTLLFESINNNCPLFINTDSFFSDASDNYNYLNHYSLSKLHFRQWLQSISRNINTKIVNMKLFHLYGPNDNSDKFVTKILKECRNNISEISLTSGTQKMDFIYISDAIDAFLKILENSSNLEKGYVNYDLGSGKLVSIKKLVKMIHHYSGSKSKLSFGAIAQRTGEFSDIRANISNLKKIGWKQEINLEDGIQKLVENS